MANNLIVLYSAQPGITNTTLYTAETRERVRILAATVANDTTSTAYIAFHRVPFGDSAGDANIIVPRMFLGSRESKIISQLIGHVLQPGDFLSAIAQIADQLTVHISGILITP